MQYSKLAVGPASASYIPGNATQDSVIDLEEKRQLKHNKQLEEHYLDHTHLKLHNKEVG